MDATIYFGQRPWRVKGKLDPLIENTAKVALEVCVHLKIY